MGALAGVSCLSPNPNLTWPPLLSSPKSNIILTLHTFQYWYDEVMEQKRKLAWAMAKLIKRMMSMAFITWR